MPEADVLGKESAAGFVNLLRRNIPSRDVLNVCLAEWQKSFAHGAKVSPTKLERIQAIIAAENALRPSQRNSIKAYRTIHQILSDRSEFRVPSSESQSTTKRKERLWLRSHASKKAL